MININELFSIIDRLISFIFNFVAKYLFFKFILSIFNKF